MAAEKSPRKLTSITQKCEGPDLVQPSQSNADLSEKKAAPTPNPDPPAIQNTDNVISGGDSIEPVPVLIASETFRSAKLEDIDKEVASRYTKKNRKKIKSFYSNQNELIDQYLGVGDEEQLAAEEERRMRPKIRFAVYASFFVNLCLFIIQLYAAISTGSLSVRSSRGNSLGARLLSPRLTTECT